MKFIFIDTFAIDQLTRECPEQLSSYLQAQELHIVITPMLLIEYFSPVLQTADRTERALQLLLKHPFVIANQGRIMAAEEEAYPDLLSHLPFELGSMQFLDPLAEADKVTLLGMMLHHGIPDTGFDLKRWAERHHKLKHEWAESVQAIIDNGNYTGNLADKQRFTESLDLRLCDSLLETVYNLEQSERQDAQFFRNISKLYRINEQHDTFLMPGIHLSSLMIWYDYVVSGKKINASDWADIFHAILYCYCDVVIADASRIDCIRRIQRDDQLYKGVKFYNKKEFLAALNEKA